MFKNFDPGLVFFTFRGILVRGFASGSMITVARANDGFAMDVGSQGDVTRVRSRDKTGTITLRLQAASPTNDLLSALVLLDEQTGLGYGPASLTNLNETTIVESPWSWIQKWPDIEQASDASVREWVFGCAELSPFAGSAVI